MHAGRGEAHAEHLGGIDVPHEPDLRGEIDREPAGRGVVGRGHGRRRPVVDERVDVPLRRRRRDDPVERPSEGHVVADVLAVGRPDVHALPGLLDARGLVGRERSGGAGVTGRGGGEVVALERAEACGELAPPDAVAGYRIGLGRVVAPVTDGEKKAEGRWEGVGVAAAQRRVRQRQRAVAGRVDRARLVKRRQGRPLRRVEVDAEGHARVVDVEDGGRVEERRGTVACEGDARSAHQAGPSADGRRVVVGLRERATRRRQQDEDAGDGDERRGRMAAGYTFPNATGSDRAPSTPTAGSACVARRSQPPGSGR